MDLAEINPERRCVLKKAANRNSYGLCWIVDKGGNTYRTLFNNTIGEKLGAVHAGILRLKGVVANTSIKSH